MKINIICFIIVLFGFFACIKIKNHFVIEKKKNDLEFQETQTLINETKKLISANIKHLEELKEN